MILHHSSHITEMVDIEVVDIEGVATDLTTGDRDEVIMVISNNDRKLTTPHSMRSHSGIMEIPTTPFALGVAKRDIWR